MDEHDSVEAPARPRTHRGVLRQPDVENRTLQFPDDAAGAAESLTSGREVTMKLATVDVEGKARPGRIADDHIIDLSGIGPDLRSILESGGLDRARRAEGRKISLKGARLLAPIQNPALVLSVGMNYHEHLKEMKTPAPEKPAAFTKSVARLIGPEAAIL